MSNEEQYIHDYESEHAKKVVGTRTIDNSARFFLPYLKPGMDLLDCGCGPGSITLGLAEAVAPGQVVGVDIGESQVDAANARAAELGITNAKFEVGDLYNLQYPENTFDAAFSHTVFEHLSDHVKAASQMHRVLKPSGFVGIRTTDFMGLIFSPSNEILDNAWDMWERFRCYNGGDTTVGRRLRTVLREAGFVNVEWNATYDNWATPDKVQSLRDVFLVEMAGPVIREQVSQLGWQTPEDFDAIERALKDWGEHPDALLAISQCEVIGWKE